MPRIGTPSWLGFASVAFAGAVLLVPGRVESSLSERILKPCTVCRHAMTARHRLSQ